ncbi:MAG: hypothetical protein ACE5HY_06040, partial [Candidatus Hydrothermarchaeales archaeon]
IMGSGLRLVEPTARRGKWGSGLLAKFLLTWKLIMLIDKELPFKINIPIFHHSIIPCAGQKRQASKITLNFSKL